MRKFLRKGRDVVPSAVPAGAPPAFSAPPPSTPAEVGLALRAARERGGLGLDEVRDRTGVPKVDLDALEQGRFDLLLVEQAAVVALWRFAELVGLDASELVGVLRNHWPHRALAVDAFRLGPSPESMPLARLSAARQLLSPITGTRQLGTGSSGAGLGLSEATRQLLASTSSSTAIAVAALGPGRAGRRPRTRTPAAQRRPPAGDDDDGGHHLAATPPTVAPPPVAPSAVAANEEEAPAPVAGDEIPARDAEPSGPSAELSSVEVAPPDAAARAGAVVAGGAITDLAPGVSIPPGAADLLGSHELAGAGGDDGTHAARQRGWAGHVARVIAERFGIEPVAEPYEIGGEDLAT